MLFYINGEQRKLFVLYYLKRRHNMALGGYADKVAWVDLTSGKTEFKPIPEEYKLKYVGARGVGVKFVFDNGPEVDPLSPDNILCFMNGPMTGS
jgi:aldehyde:ferredoxin oxidoreductase